MSQVRIHNAVARLRNDHRLLVELDGKPVILLAAGESEYVAYFATCPHRGAPLEQATMIGPLIVCPWHRAMFDAASGAHVGGPDSPGLTPVPLMVDGPDVLIGGVNAVN